MNEFAKKYKLILVIVIYAGLAGAFVYFFLRPLIMNLEKLSYDVQAKAVDRDIEGEKIQKLPEINKEWSQYTEQESNLNVILGQEDQVGFIESVESMAQASGNKAELKIQDKEKDFLSIAKNSDIIKNIPYTNYLPIQITLEGSYGGLVNFIHMLENGQFYVNIVSVSAIRNANQNAVNHSVFSLSSRSESETENKTESIKSEIEAIVYMKKQ